MKKAQKMLNEFAVNKNEHRLQMLLLMKVQRFVNSFKYPLLKEYITLLHAVSGCDTTSAFYNQGKLKFITILS